MGHTPVLKRPTFCGGVIGRGLGCIEGYAFDLCLGLRSYTSCGVVQGSFHTCALAPTYLLSLAIPPVIFSYLEGGESHRVEEALQGNLLYAS